MDNLYHKGHNSDQNPVWRNSATDSIRDSILIIEKKGPGLIADHPVKLDNVVAIICLKGRMEGTLNLQKYKAVAPGMFIALSGQILHSEHFSNDFHGIGLVLSKGFWKDFSFDNTLAFPLSRSIRDDPWIPLKADDIESVKEYFSMLRKAIRKVENQNRKDAARFLTMAFFYGFGYQFHKIPDEMNKSRQDILVEKFLALVGENYRTHRDPQFYADKMFLTPKHLSKVLKQKSRKSAAEWIEDHVILEAKALLKSTNKSVLQISDELNFPSQSFFGKYFKRRTGISPLEYRKTV